MAASTSVSYTHLERQPVIPVQTVLGSEPHKAFPILQNLIHGVLLKTVPDIHRSEIVMNLSLIHISGAVPRQYLHHFPQRIPRPLPVLYAPWPPSARASAEVAAGNSCSPSNLRSEERRVEKECRL